MDFLDLQIYADTINIDKKEKLADPAMALPLYSPMIVEKHDKFQLPNLHEKHEDHGETIHDKMLRYVNIAIDILPEPNMNMADSSSITPANTSFQTLLTRKKSSIDAVLSKKLAHVLDDYNHIGRQSDIQLRKSLNILQKFENDLHLESDELIRHDFIGSLSRKSLRSNLENELLKLHSSTLDDFCPIVRRIKRLVKPIEQIQKISHEILNSEINGVNDHAWLIDTHLSDMLNKLKQLKSKKLLLTGIRDNLTLTQVEHDCLQNGPINESYFEIINKIMQIKEKATYLLAFGDLKAVNFLLEQSMSHLEVCNRKIYNYLVDFLHEYESISKTFGERLFNESDTSLTIFQRSLIYLSNDLQYFGDFLKKVTNMRSKKVLDDFLSQFDINTRTNGIHGILLPVHDPIRYLGDILAYIHSLIVNENDFIHSLFKFQNKNIENTPKSILQERSEFLNGLDNKILNDIFNFLSISIKIRLDQIIRFEQDSLVNFDISQLLKLYQMMFIRSNINESSVMINNLKELENTCNIKTINNFTNYLTDVENGEDISTDLLPPEWVINYLSKLCELFEKLEKSKDSGILTNSFYQTLLVHPFEEILVPQLKSHFPLAKKNNDSKSKLLILEINTFDTIKTRLTLFHSFIFGQGIGSEVYNKITMQLDTFSNQLLECERKYLYESTGLELYNNLFNMIFPVEAIQDDLDYDMYYSTLENPIMSLESIKMHVHDKLNLYLTIALTDFQETRLFHLNSPKIVDYISLSIFQNFCRFYTIFRNAILRLYPDQHNTITSILNFSEQDVGMLLGIKL